MIRDFDMRSFKFFDEMERQYPDIKLFDEFDKAWLVGELACNFELYELKEIKYYKTIVKVQRLSENVDNIPVMVDETFDVSSYSKGDLVEIGGIFKSCNKIGRDKKSHLCLYVHASSIKQFNNPKVFNNMVFLEGFISKRPIMNSIRKSGFVTNTIVAVNDEQKNSYYIPCMTWNEKALFLFDYGKVGDQILIYGRIQSREYFKRNSPRSTIGEYKKTIEVSIYNFKIVK